MRLRQKQKLRQLTVVRVKVRARVRVKVRVREKVKVRVREKVKVRVREKTSSSEDYVTVRY